MSGHICRYVQPIIYSQTYSHIWRYKERERERERHKLEDHLAQHECLVGIKTITQTIRNNSRLQLSTSKK